MTVGYRSGPRLKGGRNVDIIIRDSYEEMSKYAAGKIAEFIRKKPDCVLGLATGSTPLGTYRELVRMHKEEGLDFSEVRTFNLDEYFGIGIDLEIPYNQDQSYARFMYEELLKHINIKEENVHVPDGRTKDPEKYCAWYEDEIKRVGGIDLQLLGIGRDGHWAFNEPGSSLASRTRIQALAKETLDDNYESFYKNAGIARDQMPHFAITMGVGTILEARNIMMIASGKKKADVIAKAIEGPVTSQITASAIQLHPGGVMVVLDREAAACLANRDYYIYAEKIKKQYSL
jgi:glucosamine-6-phosphate deaminase